MKILPTVNNTTVSSVKTRNKTKKQYPQCDSVSFKRIDFDAARAIQNRIASTKGISMNVNGNAFVAECYEKVIEVFEKLFKKSYLPSFVGTAKFTSDSCFGQYSESYIDYFTQQVWNGDIDEAKRTGDLVERYLAELEAERVAPIVQRVAATTEKVPLLNRIGDFLVSVSENITDALDRKNKITIRR